MASTQVSVELNDITEAKHDDRTKPWRVGAGGFARRQLPQAEPQALAAALTAAGLTAQARPRAAKPGLLARLVKDGLIDVDHWLPSIRVRTRRRAQSTHRLVCAMGFPSRQLAYLDRAVGDVHTAKDATSSRRSGDDRLVGAAQECRALWGDA